MLHKMLKLKIFYFQYKQGFSFLIGIIIVKFYFLIFCVKNRKFKKIDTISKRMYFITYYLHKNLFYRLLFQFKHCIYFILEVEISNETIISQK
jgi:hypothetical protein